MTPADHEALVKRLWEIADDPHHKNWPSGKTIREAITVLEHSATAVDMPSRARIDLLITEITNCQNTRGQRVLVEEFIRATALERLAPVTVTEAMLEALTNAPRPERFVHAGDVNAIDYADWFHKVRGKALAAAPPPTSQWQTMEREKAQAVAHEIAGVLYDTNERGVTFPHARLLEKAFHALNAFLLAPPTEQDKP